MTGKDLFLGWSSCSYPLEVDDLVSLPDFPEGEISAASLPDDPVILFLRPDGPDTLLRGREILLANRGGTVSVRVVFRPTIAKWNVLASVIRVFRMRWRFHGTGIYHVTAEAVRRMGLERAIRTLSNPQLRRNRDRAASMRKLETSLRTRGFDESRPIDVMLCRTGGRIDSLRQGHHRVSACLACGVSRMAMRFSAAGAVPWGRSRMGVKHVSNRKGEN